MFIPKEEAERRLNSRENLVNSLPRSSENISPDSFHLPPSFSLPLEEEEKGPISEEPKKTYQEKTIEKLLSDDPLDIETGFDRLLDLKKFSYKGAGTKALHRDVQAGIGIASSFLGTTKASRLNDVGISSAHSYENGYTSPTDLSNPLKTPKADLQNRIIQGHGIVIDKCFNRLLRTLDLLDDDKLEGVKKATDLSIIAKNLSSIVNHATAVTQDKLIENNEKSVHFHIMKPPMAQEEEYPVIEITTSPDKPLDQNDS